MVPEMACGGGMVGGRSSITGGPHLALEGTQADPLLGGS